MVDQDSKGKETIDTVQVAVRIRPLMQSETERGCDECIDAVNGEPQVQIKDLAFTYNHVFPQHITQQEFYDTAVRGLIGRLFQGYNVTILAYGQTGSGKTYTMGTNYSGSTGDSTKLGVIPQAVADIFDYIETHEDKFIFKVSVSFMELYQEQCYDLLSGKERGHSIIDIREDVNKGVILPGLTLLPVSSTRDTMMVLERGSAGRVTGSTAMNEASSRSHAVFTIVISKESRTDKNLATTSKFHLVDLAGSERIKKTKASGERLREGVKINQGLLALGNVISALGDGTNRSYICYRDSKLTRLLQDSLGGNSLTLMVACVSPADYNLDETVSTLRYADRARRIRNKPIINQDAKAAEIVRLNTLVNELRLQLVGKHVTTPRDESTEELREELEKERSKYNELLQKHKLVCDQLGNMLIQNSNLCDKALLAEAAREKIERKLVEMKEQCDVTIDNLTEKDEDADKTNIIEYIKDIKCQLEELQSVNLKTDSDMIDRDMDMLTSAVGGDRHDDDMPMSEDIAVMEQEKRAMGQYILNQELQELNRAMAIKASVVQTILASNKDVIENQTALKENQDKIASLERQRDELLQQVNKSKSKDPSVEERRNKVTALEHEITELKKKCQIQANIIRSKEKNEAKITALNNELQAMKATKVKIVKRMREESEKFRKWKMDNERAMLRLKNEDRKRATAMAKMESLHAKQQSVLKRKMEEAVAVNKRLKEALEKQKHYQVKRNAKGNLKVSAVQQYIEQELEVHLSIVEAEKSLEELMEYRAWITEQIELLRRSDDSEGKEHKMRELEQDLTLRKAQISDLQQKIIIADQENKSRTQWDNIQSMLEAKVALKCLFDLLVDAKRDLSNTSDKGYQAKYEQVKEAHDRLAVEFENSKSEFERQLATIRIQSEEKLSALVSLQRGVMGQGDRNEACKHLQNVIQYQQERLEQFEDENKKLSEELDELRALGCVGKKQQRPTKKQGRSDSQRKVEYIDLTDEDDDDEEDRDDDPDWRATPLMKRINAHRSRLTMNFNQNQSQTEISLSKNDRSRVLNNYNPDQEMEQNEDGPSNKAEKNRANGNGSQKQDQSQSDSNSSGSSRAVKRTSDGSSHCSCRGSCSTKLCGCVKTDKGCADTCKCQRELCKNRRLSSDSGGDKENFVLPNQEYLNATPSHYCDANGRLNATFIKRKKSYFFPQNASVNHTEAEIKTE